MTATRIWTLASVTLALLAAGAQAQTAQQPSPYAIEGCASGCFALKERGAAIYTGADAASYRICSRSNLGAEISVDSAIVRISNRDCTDVNGRSIVLNSGEIALGRLPR
ncbi:hypothetical protein GQ37_012110 [Janthinobacterium sp. BJB1]|uniref:hypothetical protein n=1 Tax=Janthinobacterium sp. GW458P TaxID=1981504 RepID=UPI000A3209A0|nr:hypothetical protein [Janthinobacterium sp. GW458P]MBE3023340.1 hypothetical protein [Janthinobacterium sp. GW458P]PHV18959.1 hypothetical protein CSQ90_04475 [Janthinobacterium sp. BJB303]PJC98411.1 hypothetical protein GQ37_012110 [Janthinobacterium sp. BJB1]